MKEYLPELEMDDKSLNLDLWFDYRDRKKEIELLSLTQHEKDRAIRILIDEMKI
jgi:hypothetical protein